MLHQLQSAPKSQQKRKRVGRGNGSGNGTYSGRGSKGQKARSKVRIGFEGGQLPLTKRMPSLRGFTNNFRVEYQPVNLKSIAKFDIEGITPSLLLEKGIVRKKNKPIKILSLGEITRPQKIYAHAFSATAKTKIEAAGGTAIVLPRNSLVPESEQNA